MTILFRNHQWKVLKSGMDTVDNSYWIDRPRLTDRWLARPDLYCWPMHMAGKVWIDIDAFCEAFTKALEITVPSYDREKVARTVGEAVRKKEEAVRFCQRLRERHPGKTSFTAADLHSAI